MKYYTLFFRNIGKMLQNLSSAAVVIGALRVKQENKLFLPYKIIKLNLDMYCLASLIT